MSQTVSTVSASQLAINAIRFLAIDAVQRANSGHPGAPMGMAPMAYTLWRNTMLHNPQNPNWFNRDRFVLSAGHASMLLYALLHLTGYPLSIKDLQNFRQWGSKTPGHPEYGMTIGVEATTGPLGQGVSNAVGMAFAERMLADKYNRPNFEVVNHRTYVIISDGDVEEGVAAESAALAGVHKLGNLVVLYDDNQISIDGATKLHLREDVAARYAAYGWQTLGPIDGNDLVAIDKALRSARREVGKPSLIRIRTTIGYGSPNLAGSAATHGAPLGVAEVELTRRNLGWRHAPFEIPKDVYSDLREHCLQKGAHAEQLWDTVLENYTQKHPRLARRFKSDIANELPAGWGEAIGELTSKMGRPMSTRVASGMVLNELTKQIPQLLGGSADLGCSNNTLIQHRSPLQPENRAGRNLYFGIREHAMGAICNGLALHGGFIPYGATFLIFSDYMRPAIRLSALSKLQTIWLFTHDSIGLGEDGPTHQPVSQLMSLRMIPDLTVIRPADGLETAYAWRIAIRNRRRPTAIVLARQKTPSIQDAGGITPTAAKVGRGAYAVYDPPRPPQALVIATGSEVHLAILAAHKLGRKGIAVRAISMPSWDLFESQSKQYRTQLLPPQIKARVAVEAGTPLGWERYVGLTGSVVGVNKFGRSAPGAEVLKRYGFSVDNLVTQITRVMEQV